MALARLLHLSACADPAKVDPASVDWQAVATGKQLVRVRELPGPKNSMGKPVATKSRQPEQAIALTVPVYLTYLTVAPSKKGVKVLDDVYGMD